jgi:hypothetical protein
VRARNVVLRPGRCSLYCSVRHGVHGVAVQLNAHQPKHVSMLTYSQFDSAQRFACALYAVKSPLGLAARIQH